MTFFHALQIAFLAWVLYTLVEKVRSMAFVGALETKPLLRAIAEAVEAGDRERAIAITAAARPAWVAEAIWPLLDPSLEEGERETELTATLMDLEAESQRSLRALRVGGSISSSLGFVGVALAIRWIFTGEHGLDALQAGYVESVALERALISFSIGLATATLSFGSWMMLRTMSRQLRTDFKRAPSRIEAAQQTRRRALEAPDGSEPASQRESQRGESLDPPETAV